MTARSLSFTEPTQGRLRRLNLVTSFPPLVVAAAVLIVLDTHAWWDPLLLVVGVATAMLAFERWTANDLQRFVVPLLGTGVAVWLLGVLVIGSPNAYWGLATAGGLAVPQLPRLRLAAFGGLLACVAGVGSLRLLIDGDDALLTYVLVPVGLTALTAVLCFAGEAFYDVVRELEASRAREAELAVIRERVRFAGDLHDVQGHTLHVVKLKATLAQKLVRTDPGRAENELSEIRGLVSDTIQQTKDLAYAQRRLNLAAELENAKNLFEAAGIRVRVTREAEADARASELLGQVLRETTTNVLRHAEATSVRIVLGAHRITIVNDGAPGDGPPELRGLSTLRQRLADDGGSLTVARHDGEFTTAASVR